MVKKISAIVLALVLCLSVVVLPVSAAGFGDDYSLPSGDKIAFKVELDKDYYSAGDTATVSIYVVADESSQFGAGVIAVGFNTAVFNATDNTATTIKDSATSTDLFNSYYKSADISSWGLLTDPSNTHMKKIIANNTEEENALYDAYAKITVARDMNGSHENAASTRNGIYGSEISSTSEPLITFQLTVAADVADGTPINVGITSGSVSAAADQTYFKVFRNPGNATTADNTDETTTDMSSLVTSATVGEEVIELPDLAMTKWKQQIKFGVKDGVYNNTFSTRTLVEFTNFSEVFDNAADALDTADGDGLLEVGFVYFADSAEAKYNETTAKNYITAGVLGANGVEKSNDGYTIDRNAYISSTAKADSYVMGYTVTNIDDASKTTNLTVLAYAKYTTGGEPVYAYLPVSGTFETLYNTFFDQAFPG